MPAFEISQEGTEKSLVFDLALRYVKYDLNEFLQFKLQFKIKISVAILIVKSRFFTTEKTV